MIALFFLVNSLSLLKAFNQAILACGFKRYRESAVVEELGEVAGFEELLRQLDRLTVIEQISFLQEFMEEMRRMRSSTESSLQ